MASDEGQKVLLYVYDLSQGFAAQVSQSLLGKHVSSLKILEQTMQRHTSPVRRKVMRCLIAK